MKKRCFAFLLLTVAFLLMFPLAALADVIQEPDSLLNSIEEATSAGEGGIPVFAIVLVAVLVVVTIMLIRTFWKRK